MNFRPLRPRPHDDQCICGNCPELADVCTCCGRRINAGRAVWLELDQRTGEYHDAGGVPPEQSQGWFVFGADCAARARRAAKAAAAECLGHPAGTAGVMGETVYCDGTCRRIPGAL